MSGVVKRSHVRTRDMSPRSVRLRGGEAIKVAAWGGVVNMVVRRLARSE